MSVQPLDRRDTERMLKHLLHVQNDGEYDVRVGFLVQFSGAGDKERSVTVALDPWQPFPRRNATELVKSAIKAIKEAELAADTGGVENDPAPTSEGLPETTNPTGASADGT